MSKYIKQAMLRHGIKPIMDILYETDDLENVNAAESSLIDEYGKENTLLNIAKYVPVKKEKGTSCAIRASKSGTIFRCKDWKNCDFCFNERVRSVRERLITTIDDNGVDCFYSIVCTDNDIRKLRKEYGRKRVIRMPCEGYIVALLAIDEKPHMNHSVIKRRELTYQYVMDNYARTPAGTRISGGSGTKL